ncbi:MAG: DUF1778 domain-containing protein [Saccharospirillaceae bacterium]|nr:DUF1778 domain-containing protein [Pseudomonadales bacterium]NRB81259.1 DUF1778 domain-containing protein [Saccharospirillaceae bacterium]
MAKDTAINMRVEASQQALLSKAASVLNMDRTAFILNVACKEAQSVLLDQRIFMLDDTSFADFEAALDAPIESRKLKTLLEEVAPWEK